MRQNEPDLQMYERERIVFEIIKNNSELHHNALLKLIVPKFMAKTTFEKTRNSLLDKEMISESLKGNMKFYTPVENYEQKSFQQIEHFTNTSFHDLKLEIKRLEIDYPRKDVDEKIRLASFLLKSLLKTDNGFTLLDSIKNPKKTLYRDEHLTLQQLVFKVLKIVKTDSDLNLIYPTIISHFGVMFR